MLLISKEKKIPNGKLLQVSFALSPADPPHLVQLQSFRITGDFFIHPEESISLIESIGRQWKFPSSRFDRLSLLQQAIQSQSIQIVGFSPQDLVELVEEAVHDEPH